MSSKSPFSLDGKVILVTGASSGIGKQIAIESSRFGAKLIITGRDRHRLNNTFKQLEGQDHIQVTADLTDALETESLIKVLSPLDGIVHVAGIIKPKLFQFMNSDDLHYLMEINFFSPIILTNNIFKKKLFKKCASIVFISSISGTVCSSVGGSTYSASKGAINGIVKAMALDLAPKGIRLNTVLPGMIESDFFNESPISSEQLDVDKKRYPLGRFGKPEDVAYASIYLLSDASSWMTGSNLLIDGGFTLM